MGISTVEAVISSEIRSRQDAAQFLVDSAGFRHRHGFHARYLRQRQLLVVELLLAHVSASERSPVALLAVDSLLRATAIMECNSLGRDIEVCLLADKPNPRSVRKAQRHWPPSGICNVDCHWSSDGDHWGDVDAISGLARQHSKQGCGHDAGDPDWNRFPSTGTTSRK